LPLFINPFISFLFPQANFLHRQSWESGASFRDLGSSKICVKVDRVAREDIRAVFYINQATQITQSVYLLFQD